MSIKFLLPLFIVFLLTFGSFTLHGQTGLTVGPPRLYFVANGGQTQLMTVDVTNPSADYTLELAVSMEDWKYSTYGENILKPKGSFVTSCADWLSVSESFFALKPGESKTLQVNMRVPEGVQYIDTLPVHTAMLYVTQLNPRTGPEKHSAANIRMAVRSGIKIYHRFNGKESADLEITDLQYIQADSISKFLQLDFNVTGNTWTDGVVRVEFINQENGKKTVLDNMSFFTLPGDKRTQYIEIPQNLTPGIYLAAVMLFYGEQEKVKAAELEFNYETSQ